MKRYAHVFTVLLGSCSALCGQADISGKWAGFPIYATFHQEGTKLTGTAGQSDDNQIPLEDGSVEEGRIRFHLGDMQAELHVEGNVISGDVHQGPQSLKIVLHRMKVRDASAPPPEFDAASLKPSPPPPDGKGMNSTMRAEPGRLTFINVTLRQYITRAWNLKDYQVNGPSWLNERRYDLSATMAAGTPPEDVFLMLRTLLTKRFSLAVHEEKRELPVYALMVDKGGLKLPPGVSMGHTNIDGGAKGRTLTADVTLTSLAATLSGLVDRPVIDLTETKGSFHIVLEWTPDDAQGEAVGASIFTAVRERGLKLDPRKAPLTILVVDSAEKEPAEN